MSLYRGFFRYVFNTFLALRDNQYVCSYEYIYIYTYICMRIYCYKVRQTKSLHRTASTRNLHHHGKGLSSRLSLLIRCFNLQPHKGAMGFIRTIRKCWGTFWGISVFQNYTLKQEMFVFRCLVCFFFGLIPIE